MTFERIEPSFKNLSIEATRSKETDFQLKQVITISGFPGTGKSLILNALSVKYGLPSSLTISIGEFFRQQAFLITNKEILGFYERPVREDIAIDSLQKELLKDHNPKIIESRLGGWFAKKINSQKGISSCHHVISILLTGRDEVLKERVYKRDKKRHSELTFEVSSKYTEERNKLDLVQFRKAYPELNELNPLDANSKNMYDLHLDVTTVSKDSVINIVHEFLIGMGAVQKMKKI